MALPRWGRLAVYELGDAHAHEAMARIPPDGRAGHVYQGRFKSFLIQQDGHLLTVCRYVERNAVRAQLVERVEQWRWSSAGDCPASDRIVPLSEGPLARPADWLQWVNEPQTGEELAAIRRSVVKGRPYGAEDWVSQMVVRWTLQATIRAPGRPRKEPKNDS